MCEYNEKKDNLENDPIPQNNESESVNAQEISHEEHVYAESVQPSSEQEPQTPVQQTEDNNVYSSGANPENYTTYSWSANGGQTQETAPQESSSANTAPIPSPYTASQYPYSNYYGYPQQGVNPQAPYGQNPPPYQGYAGQTPPAYPSSAYPQNAYQQPYQTVGQPAPKKKREKKPKEPKERFLTRRAAAVFMAICIVAAGAVGVGGGVVAYNLAQGNKTSSGSSGLNINQGGTPATQTASKGSALSIAEITAKAENSVVEIVTEAVTTNNYMQQFIQQGAGSGVIIDSNGYIATNNHVIEGASKITVTLKNGESYDATLVATDSETDVALLKIEATNLQAAVFGDSSTLQVGETAVAIGNPLGQLGGTVTNGIVSALDRQITIDGKTMTLMQTNAAINPGNSGGGLFNGNGELIGLVVAKSSTAADGTAVEGLGFAIPVNTVKDVVEQLKQYGYVKGRVQLGVSLLDITSSQQAMMYRVNQPGVYIQQISAGGAAEKAGLQVGDCITSVDGTDVSTASDVKAVLQKHSVGDTITIKVMRSSREVEVQVTLQESVPTNNDSSSSQSGANGQQDGNYGGNNGGYYGGNDNNLPFGS